MVGRSPTLGPDARPVAVPDDVDDDRYLKAAGRIELPLWIRWSGDPVVYDLENPIERNRVYEQVLREGTDDDVRQFIVVNVLADQWDKLVVPPRVRRAWATWFRRHRGVELPC